MSNSEESLAESGSEAEASYTCDHCGITGPSGESRPYSSLPVNIASANAGESAVLCPQCDARLEARCQSEYWRSGGWDWLYSRTTTLR